MDDTRRLRRGDRRWRSCRPERSTGAGPSPAPGRRDRRRRAPQRSRRAHAGVPVPRRDAAQRSCWPPAGPRSPATASRSSTAPWLRSSWSPTASCTRRPIVVRLAGGRRTERTTAARRPPASATRSPTSPASASGGDGTCCTARTATAGRSATSPSASSARSPARSQHALLVRQWSDDVIFFAHTYDLTDVERDAARRPRHHGRDRARSRASSSRTTASPASSSPTAASSSGPPCSSGPASTRTPTGSSPGSGCEFDDAGFVTVDATGRTTTPGVWAAGNVVDPRAQVITAAGAGSAAAIAINADLVRSDVECSVRARSDTARPAPLRRQVARSSLRRPEPATDLPGPTTASVPRLGPHGRSAGPACHRR